MAQSRSVFLYCMAAALHNPALSSVVPRCRHAMQIFLLSSRQKCTYHQVISLSLSLFLMRTFLLFRFSLCSPPRVVILVRRSLPFTRSNVQNLNITPFSGEWLTIQGPRFRLPVAIRFYILALFLSHSYLPYWTVLSTRTLHIFSTPYRLCFGATRNNDFGQVIDFSWTAPGIENFESCAQRILWLFG